MHLFLETTVLLVALGCVVDADISSGSGRRVQDLDDAADEAHDTEILKAVVTSMEQWNRKRNHARFKRSQPNSVCYEELGCFEDSGPFGYLEMLPSSPQEINTRFLLYSTKSRGDIPLLDVPFGNMSMAWRWADLAFNSSSPTKVIVHGFGSNCDHVWVYEMRSALMAVEECNVICVDWEAGALVPNYVRAAANTRLVGKQLAMLLEGLSNHINLKFENVHLIGFSLGAHVAGFAGSQLKNISRITGLDPAGPLFEAQDARARLDSSDAKFVDVIHSNGENLILGGLGSWQPMGHVDFYPNGGRMQTGCSNLFVGAVTDIIWSSAVEGRSLCNHRRAYKFFTDSVSPKCHFPSFPCNSYDEFLSGNCFGCNGDKRCGNMGYYADRSTGRGQLYLLTRDEEPFCAHQYHVKIESTKNNQSLVSYGRIMLELVGDSGLNETFPMTRKDDSELILGSTISRMLVPHPALGVPVKVQLQYQAYSGWLSSGLNQWTIDKIVLSDSFGKISSMCKKGLILNSGVPVTLPLYPGDCSHSTEMSENYVKNKTIDRMDNENGINNEKVFNNKPTFIPTQVVQIGDELIHKSQRNIETIASSSSKREDVIVPNEKSNKNNHIKSKNKIYSSSEGNTDEKLEPNIIQMGKHFRIDNDNSKSDPLFSILDVTDVFNLPWQPLLANSLDNSPNERESGRAFGSINTKFHSFSFLDKSSNQTTSEIISEIVEPILKAPSTKNARSHDINKLKSEITEPILGSTTVKVDTVKTTDYKSIRTNRTPKTFEEPSIEESSNIERSISVSSDESIWKPTFNLLPSESKESIVREEINNKSTTEKSNPSTEKSETFSLFQWQNKDKKNKKDAINDASSNSIASYTVQFLPTRLVSFLEKAESYARNTILPLVSAYTPKFLFFGQDSETTTKKSKKSDLKFVPIDEKLNNLNATIPKQTQKEKIDIIKNIQPPNDTENAIIKIERTTTTSFKNTNKPIFSMDEFKYSQNDPIKIVKAPDMTTTTLAPVTIQSQANSSEKLIIVYPSNARDDRKIQSRSYPEIMQFESLYQQSINQNPEESRINTRIDTSRQYNSKVLDKPVRVELPTYEPPASSTQFPFTKPYSTTPKFIPVSFP